jgi:hypothetical protein
MWETGRNAKHSIINQAHPINKKQRNSKLGPDYIIVRPVQESFKIISIIFSLPVLI